MREWVTSDTHFDHKNILQFEPSRSHFQSVEDMNQHIITEWNKVVQPDDIVYHLGDFGMNLKYPRFKELLEQLNGFIILTQGNHDDSKTVRRLHEEGLITLHEVGFKMKRNKQVLWFSHYPMEIGIRPRKWSICGHIHNLPNTYINQINGGVDSPFAQSLNKPFGQPIAMEDLLQHIENLTPQIEEDYRNRAKDFDSRLKEG